MQDLAIVSDFKLEDNDFIFEVQCDEGKPYIYTVGREELESCFSKSTGIACYIEDHELEGEFIHALAQEVLTEWEHSEDKDFYNVEVKKAKITYFWFDKATLKPKSYFFDGDTLNNQKLKKFMDRGTFQNYEEKLLEWV